MNKDTIIILGTAHLATTPGKGSPDGRFREYAYSRKVVGEIAEALRADGFTVFIDYMAPNPSPQMKGATWKQEQSRELAWRANFVNTLCAKYGKQNCIYVSVHNNAAGADGKWHDARGWCAFTSRGQTQADVLASHLYDAAKIALKDYIDKFSSPDPKQRPIRTDYTDGDPDLEAGFAVLVKTGCPAVLTENMFQDNREDVDFLLSSNGRKAIVCLHVNGIKDFIAKHRTT